MSQAIQRQRESDSTDDEYSDSETLSLGSRGVSDPYHGHDTADGPDDGVGAECENCKHSSHAHDKGRVYPDDGPAGTYHYVYVCP